MPYIDKKARKIYDEFIHSLVHQNIGCSGKLNYILTKICHEYIKQHGLTYANINEVVGVLSCAQMEFYRMIAVPLERQKRRENGPVSNLEISDE